MTETNRVFRIIKMIMLLRQPYGRWDVNKITETFDISARTFHRDKKIMEELGIPIYYDRHLKEYKILETFRLESPNLNKEETEAIMLAAKEYKNKNFPMKKELESALAKVINSLPEYIKGSLGTYINSYEIISDPFVDLKEHRQKFKLIKKSIEKQESIIIDYYALGKDEKSTRKINPYNIFFNNGAPYLIAFCNLRGEIRTFRIDRIKNIKFTDESYTIPNDYSLDEQLHNSWGVEQGEEELDVEVKFTGRAARFVPEYQWTDNQIIKKLADNEIIFSVRTTSREEIKKWILSYGAEAEVLKPEELKQEVAEVAEKMCKIYEKN
ncbi:MULTISPECIES: YafY family protein [unclassified Halanaerobium]|uniref:helix-turn-helix transcriptional regulator n=1 Tax=unclassified Halanaerobium TaxID=2641197 RepID=UPI000DF47767|nr:MULTISPECIES: WYL domain-containing protein [unclassified Halanaerobium]RCW49884.1 putative DNA-binding transcriptional regulator YafY [Halanaerobium sp. MA284_MarDTE_T2]RCW88530.1 putative DNA-binding transcriptional regulator YafY [Halanaerobium sp. DL-01]